MMLILCNTVFCTFVIYLVFIHVHEMERLFRLSTQVFLLLVLSIYLVIVQPHRPLFTSTPPLESYANKRTNFILLLFLFFHFVSLVQFLSVSIYLVLFFFCNLILVLIIKLQSTLNLTPFSQNKRRLSTIPSGSRVW